jgi:hypothetical protein
MLFRRSFRVLALALICAAAAPACRPAPPLAPVAKAIAAAVPDPASPLLELVATPPLSVAGEALILEFETGGQPGYDPRPEWPGDDSGFTIGVGYDCGYYSRAAIAEDWCALPPSSIARIVATAGHTGANVRAEVRACHDILVAWSIATGVFDRVDLPGTWEQCEKIFPGFAELRPNAQAALVSLVFNRGSSLIGSNRLEMRAIAALTPKRDYAGIAGELRAMVRVWRGTDIYAGMSRRRYAEATLVQTQ